MQKKKKNLTIHCQPQDPQQDIWFLDKKVKVKTK